ncbi:MAG: hypothetical protein AB7I18_10170 [Candidatus Berkiella sp.]
MAKKIQKKIATALTRRRTQLETTTAVDDWKTLIKASGFNIIIPTLDSIQINMEQYQNATPERLQDLFNMIVDILKREYFDQQQNRSKLKNHLVNIHHNIHNSTNVIEKKTILVQYFKLNEKSLTLLFINTQLELAIKFSRLLICVVGRLVKDALNLPENQYDNDNIVNLIEELNEIHPNLSGACQEWFEEEYHSYKPNAEDEVILTKEQDNEDLDDLLTEPLTEIVIEQQGLDENDIIEELLIELHDEEPVFSRSLLDFFSKAQPIINLSNSTITKSALRKAYLKMNNMLMPELELKEKYTKKRFREFIIQVINHKINIPGSAEIYDLGTIRKTCKQVALELSAIFLLCKQIKQIRANHQSFLDEISNLTDSDELTTLESFIKRKLQAPLYLKIKKRVKNIINYKDYGSSCKTFTIDCIRYLKMLLTQPIYENSIVATIKVDYPSIIEPISLDDLSHVKACVTKLDQYTAKKVIKNECSYLLHTLAFDQELALHLQSVFMLCTADLNDIITYLLEPLENQTISNLIQRANDMSLSSEPLKVMLANSEFSAVKMQVLEYQKQLRELGKLRLKAIQPIENVGINDRIDQTHHKIVNLQSNLGVIFDLISAIEVLPSDQIPDDLKVIVDEIKRHLSEVNAKLIYLNNIADDFGKDKAKVKPSDIFLYRISRGDFFHQQDHDILKNTVIAMIFSVPSLELIEAINVYFDTYSNEQKIECISFVESYIESDTLHSLFSAVNPKNNKFYQNLMTLVSLADSENISTQRLIRLIENSVTQRKQRFDTLILKIKNNELTREQLVRRINTISDKLQENSIHVIKLEDYFLEISHIMNAQNFDNFTALEQTKLFNSFNVISGFCNDEPSYQQQFSKLKRNLNVVLLKKPTEPHLQKPIKTVSKFEPKSCLLDLVRNAIDNASNLPLYDKTLVLFINIIESEFAKLFTEIDISELRDLNWTFDGKRLSSGLNPRSPNVLNYHSQFELVTQYIGIICFYHFDSNYKLVEHGTVDVVKSYYKFIENALVKALETKAPTTAFILFKAIQNSPIKRLALSSSKAEEYYLSYLSKTKESQVNITKLFREESVLPTLSFIQQMIVFSYKKSSGSEFEHLSNAGRSLRYFMYKKEQINNNTYVQTNLKAEIDYVLNSLQLLPNGKIDSVNLQRLLFKSSTNLKPDNTKKYNLTEFKTPNELVKYLAMCRTRSVDYHFASQNPEKDIYDWLQSMIKADTRFNSFTDSIEILFLIDEINRHQNRVYKQFHNDLINILTIYHRRVSKILKSENDADKKTLELFFVQLNKLKRLQVYSDDSSTGFDLFSNEQKVQGLIKKMRDQHRLYLSMQEQFEKHRSQSAYSQLLADVLSGNTQKSLTLPVEHDEHLQSTSDTLLPDNEYDIPSAEPEHPSRIGINKTMSFTSQDQASILDLFNTEELKAEFLKAFPWAIQVDTLDKLKNFQFDPHINLLGTPRLFEAPLQLAVMKLVLVAMDSLGKIAGFTGQLTLQNFDRINEIICQLKWLTGELKSFDISEPKLLGEIEAVLQEMGFKNQEFYDIQQLYNPPFEVENNPNMNGFCHLNEHLVYELTGSDYTDTLLAPTVPGSPYIEKISQIHINHEKT